VRVASSAALSDVGVDHMGRPKCLTVFEQQKARCCWRRAGVGGKRIWKSDMGPCRDHVGRSLFGADRRRRNGHIDGGRKPYREAEDNVQDRNDRNGACRTESWLDACKNGRTVGHVIQCGRADTHHYPYTRGDLPVAACPACWRPSHRRSEWS